VFCVFGMAIALARCSPVPLHHEKSNRMENRTMKPDYEIRIGRRTYGVWLLRYGAVIVRCIASHYSLEAQS
jgi:hypothetical protein